MIGSKLFSCLLAGSIFCSTLASAGCIKQYQDNAGGDRALGVVVDVLGGISALFALEAPPAAAGVVAGTVALSGKLYYSAHQDGMMITVIKEAEAGDGPHLRIAYGQAKAKNASLTFDQFKSVLLVADTNNSLCSGSLESVSDLVKAAQIPISDSVGDDTSLSSSHIVSAN